MPHYLHLTNPPDYTGTLPFSRAPGGELTFEDGATTVSDDVDVALLTDRYPNLEPSSEAPAADSAGETDAASDEVSAEETDDVSEWDEDEWLDGGYQDRADMVRTGAVDEFLDEVEAVETADTVLDAVEARRDELEG